MPSWEAALSQNISRLANAWAPERPRIAVVGIGHTLRGDDGAGMAITHRLRASLPAHELIEVLDGGAAPESLTGRLRRFRPALVVLVDAAALDTEPGTVSWVPWEATEGLSASSHTLPLNMLAQFLVLSLGCDVGLIGIQTADTTLGAPLSPAVAQAVQQVATQLADMLWQNAGEQISPAPA